MKKLLISCAAIGLLAVSCGRCYQDRFAQDVVGMSLDGVIRVVGSSPSHSQPAQGGGTLYRWSHDESYTKHHEAWVVQEQDARGFWKERQIEPEHDEFIPRRSMMVVVFRDGKAVSCQFENEGDSCNFFIPEAWLERYKREGK